MKKITVYNLDNHPTRPYQEFIDLQGDFKTYFEIKKLADRIAEAGFKYDFFTWESPEEVEHNGVTYPKETCFIIDAHARQRALQLLERDGYKIPPVPYTRIQAESLIEAKSEILYLNSRYGEIQSTSEFLEQLAAQLPPLAFENVIIPEIDLSVFNNEVGEIDELVDELPEEPEHIVIKTGDLIELGQHRVICGDATKQKDVERVMQKKKAELCFTSPPYMDMRDYAGNDLSIEMLIQFIPILYPYCAYMVINLGIKRKDYEIVEYWQNYIQKAKEVGYKFLSWNVWNREQAGFSMAQITAIFVIQHEWIFVFGKVFKELNLTVPNKTAGEFNDHSWNRQKDGTIKKGRNLTIRPFRQLGTVLTEINEQARIWTKLHPAIFPIKLPLEYIKAMTNEDEIVIDPFLGSGSTLIACEKIGRKCRGIEISEKYCQVIVQRYVNYTDNPAIRINGQDVNWEEYKQ